MTVCRPIDTLSLLSLIIVFRLGIHACKANERCAGMEAQLIEYIAGKDARIGVAVIAHGQDTVSVNGNKDFPMMSVFKFPVALAVADYCRNNDIHPDDSVTVEADDIKTGTWSPMRDKYGVKTRRMPIAELLQFALQQSDNNACDILLNLIGGTAVADSVVKASGYDNIFIRFTEDQMHTDPHLCVLNSSTPVEMAGMFDRFYRIVISDGNPFHRSIGEMMTSCMTGKNRLPYALTDTGAAIGHKTGTGDVNRQGRITALNDAGYVTMPDGHGYSIAVFVADSAYNMAETEKIIADISEIVFGWLYRRTHAITAVP